MSTKDQKIWQVVMAVPEGKVVSYGQVAEMAGLGRQARYVGRALGLLPEGHLVPWHRVIRSNGQIAFPLGSEKFEEQRQRLTEEGVITRDGRIHMKTFQWTP